jgi:hypothetical protein
MWHRVDLFRTDVSEEYVASNFWVYSISVLGTVFLFTTIYAVCCTDHGAVALPKSAVLVISQQAAEVSRHNMRCLVIAADWMAGGSIPIHSIQTKATRQYNGFSHCSTSWKFAFSIPVEVIG